MVLSHPFNMRWCCRPVVLEKLLFAYDYSEKFLIWMVALVLRVFLKLSENSSVLVLILESMCAKCMSMYTRICTFCFTCTSCCMWFCLTAAVSAPNFFPSFNSLLNVWKSKVESHYSPGSNFNNKMRL